MNAEVFTSLPPEKAKLISKSVEEWNKMAVNDFDYSTIQPEEWKGYRFIPTMSAESAQRIYEDLKIKENTVFLASFPKTGTNWCMEILYQILYGHDEKLFALAKSIPPQLTMLEFWKSEKLSLLEHIAIPRMTYVTHLPEELMNFERIKKSKAKIIVLVRNPKDQAVSWYHFVKSNPYFDGIRDEMSADWNQFISDYVQGKHPVTTKPGQWYLDYLLGWYKHKGDDSIMFLQFEDMKKDPEKAIKDMANFLNVELSNERATQVATATSFQSMKKQLDQEDNMISQIRKSGKMVRKGQVGSWKDTFTVAQSELVDKLVEGKLGHTDIEFIYEL